MYLEDVTVGAGQTLLKLVEAYGHKATEAATIWGLPENSALAARGAPATLTAGDVVQIPIPWKMKKPLIITPEARGVGFDVSRTGRRGRRLSWVQTVYRHNQPIGPNPRAFCVDACTPDDNLPFYFTSAEIAADASLRKKFSDHPSRNPPTAVAGTTRWRAIVSIAVVTDKRVTVLEPTVWGFNMTPANAITTVGPRDATAGEVLGHLSMLANGVGTSGTKFKHDGWTFRSPP
jgi:hypothetical protein